MFPHGGPPHWELCLVCPRGRLPGGAPCGCGLWCLSVWMATHRWLLLTWILSARPCYQSIYCMCECWACVRVCVSASVGVCVCVCACVWGVGSICGGGRDGLLFIYLFYFIFFIVVCFVISFCFYLVKHFGLHFPMYEKCYINKVWFDLI